MCQNCQVLELKKIIIFVKYLKSIYIYIFIYLGRYMHSFCCCGVVVFGWWSVNLLKMIKNYFSNKIQYKSNSSPL